MATYHPNSLAVPEGSRALPHISPLVRHLVDAAIIFFLVAAIYALTPIKQSLLDVERLAWLAADGVVAVLVLSRQDLFIATLRQNLTMFSWPLLAIVSFLWSITPGPSLYFALQLLMTVLVGAYLCTYADLGHLLKLLFIALLISAFLSLAYVVIDPAAALFYHGEWMGVFPHKNILGHMMAMLILTGLCLFLQGWQRRLTGPAIVFALGLLFMSRSGVGMIEAAIALAVIPIAVSIRAGRVAFALVCGAITAALAGGLLVAEIHSFDVVAGTLDAMGKDSTLTGRTILWDLGMEAFYSRWWLGFGYRGFWLNSATADQLMFIFGMDVPHFHNNFVEVAVAFGVWGPIFLSAGLLVAFVRAIRAYLADTQYVSAWPVIYLILALIAAYAESSLFANHNIYQLLFAVAMVAPVTKEHWRLSDGRSAQANRAFPDSGVRHSR